MRLLGVTLSSAIGIKLGFSLSNVFFTLVPGIYPGVERQIHFQRVTLPLNRARSRLINAASAKGHTHTQSAGRKINPFPLISANLSYPEPSNRCGGARCRLAGQTWERAPVEDRFCLSGVSSTTGKAGKCRNIFHEASGTDQPCWQRPEILTEWEIMWEMFARQ